MSNYTIRVIIEESFGRVVAEACAPMGDEFRETIQPIVLSDGVFPMFDTPPMTAMRVKAERRFVAETLAPKIAKVLMDSMEAKDLFNGYTKSERSK